MAHVGTTETFVRQTVDAVIVHVERLFERRQLVVGDEVLGARLRVGSSPQPYAWFARRLWAGMLGRPTMSYDGHELDHPIPDPTPEEALGEDLRRLGRSVHEEVVEFVARRESVGHVKDVIFDLVRRRLDWPRLPQYIEPSPPSAWTRDSISGLRGAPGHSGVDPSSAAWQRALDNPDESDGTAGF